MKDIIIDGMVDTIDSMMLLLEIATVLAIIVFVVVDKNNKINKDRFKTVILVIVILFVIYEGYVSYYKNMMLDKYTEGFQIYCQGRIFTKNNSRYLPNNKVFLVDGKTFDIMDCDYILCYNKKEHNETKTNN